MKVELGAASVELPGSKPNDYPGAPVFWQSFFYVGPVLLEWLLGKSDL